MQRRNFSWLRDARYFQIATLGSLLTTGIVLLDFTIAWEKVLAIFSTALAVQFLAGKWLGLPRFDPLSPLITSLSLTLLLRTDMLAIAALAALIAIGSKFVVRWNGKHVFNPANVALVVLTLSSQHAWLSTGQWGSATLGALLLVCLGYIVLSRARRAETTLAFLAAYSLLLLGRTLWLGDPLAIPLHQLQNGALLIFAFFMISDPMTTPNAAPGRIVYGTAVAVVAFAIQFSLFIPAAPIYALILCAPCVPLIDYLATGRRYHWRRPHADRKPEGELTCEQSRAFSPPR